MHPILFKILHFQIGTYGLLYAISFLVALRVATHYARKEGIEPARILDLGIYALLSGIIGAKLFLYLIDLPHYLRHPEEILRTWRAAGVFYGGLLFALAVGLFYLRRHRISVWKATDAVAPAAAIGQAIGRLGCFAAGCCYGIPADTPISVTFRNPEAYHLTGVTLDTPLLPTQLFHSASNFLTFFVLVFFYRRKSRPGTIFWLYLLLHGGFRFTVEFFRGDYRGPQIAGNLTTSQLIALAGFLIAGFMLLKILRSGRPAESGGGK
ncbi:MAG: prolipoprotein diacylglyceryl transferase [Acidobacteria bacterium]|nr:prolipoprotein diacylglyceryl transferase [Acidobacteriota bacterium]